MTGESLPLDRGTLGDAGAVAPRPWVRLGLAFVGSAAAAAILLLAFLVGLQVAYAGRALPGVAVAGVDIGGLSRAEAADRLESDLPSLADGTLALSVGDETTSLRYADLGREYDVQAMLDDAFAVGRSGDPIVRGVTELRALLRGVSVEAQTRWDETALAAAIGAAAADFDNPAVDATVTRDQDGRFVVTAGDYGRRFDQALAIADVRAILSSPDAPAQTTVRLSVEPIMPRVLTSQAEFARYRAELIASQDLKTHAGRDEWTIPAEQVRSWIRFEPGRYGGLSVEVVGPKLASSLEALAKDVKRDPKDAAFLTGKNGTIVGVVKGVDGRILDVTGSMAVISNALAAYEEGSPRPDVALAVIITQPKLTTEEANKVAPLMTRIGTWTTYYVPGEGNYWGKNISVPAKIISGTVVNAGSWFSFWDTVGIPTAAQGYGPGGVIQNGRSNPTGAFAGGICSCSTTIFNAALRAGLQMGKRYNHYYYIPRYPLGLDATVWMYTWTSRGDMTFKNDTGYPILIRSINKTGMVRFDIYGVPDGRKVTFSKPIIKNVVKSVDRTIETTAIPAGTQKRVEFPHDGMDVWVTRTVRRNGVIIHQETYFSDYGKVDGELWIGVAPEPEPEPTPTPTPSASTSTYFV